MANLVELSNQLEYVPQEQLVQMSQDPNSMYPSFLVLSEIQRRNQMKKMYEAQQPKPETTVAEEVVQEFAGQQGLQGAMAQSPGPQNAFQPGDMGNMAPPSPMQAMASGGLTGYDKGGDTKMSAYKKLKENQQIERELARTLLEKRMSSMSSREIDQYADAVRRQREGKESNPFRKLFEMQGFNEDGVYLGRLPTQNEGFGDIYNRVLSGEFRHGGREKYLKQLDDKIKNLRNELKLNEMGMAAGGRTGYQTGGSLGLGGDSLSKTFTNPMENQINKSSGLNLFGEDGLIFDPNNPLDYLVFVPGVGLVSKGLSSLYKGSKLLSKTAKSKVGQQAVKTDPKKRFGKPDEKGLRPLRKNEEIGKEVISDVMRPITSRPYTSAAVGLYGTSKIADAVSSDEQIIDVEPNVIENPATVRTPQESAKETVIEDVETGRKGLGNFLPNADPSMLIGLGGAIMSAKNVGELGKGISDMYLGERARKDALQMADLKGRLTEAQIRKYEADVSNMDANQIIAEMNAINKGVESGAITIDDELQAYVTSLRARLQALREKTGTGFAVSETPTLGEFLDNREIA